MRTIQLIALPLLALTFALFIYWLAAKQIPAKPVKASPIRILPLQTIEDSAPSELGAILDSKSNKAAAGADMANSESNASPVVQLKMFNKKPFIKEQYRFIPSDRMCLLMEFENLAAGKHLVSASWINPEGKTISQADHTIALDEPAARHRSYFWLELIKNGAFTEMITGKEYKGNIYGQWKAQVLLNGQPVGRIYFKIQDT